MKLLEFSDPGEDLSRYNPDEDKLNTAYLTDTRKKKLTLKMLNRLKRIRSLRRLENLKRQDLLSIMYSEAEPDAGGGMPPF